jgi:hypothetical protein
VTDIKSGRKQMESGRLEPTKKYPICAGGWGGGALKCARSEISRKGHGESAAALCIF